MLETYLKGFQSPYSIFDKSSAISFYKPRDPFAHKGSFGHALLMAGSYGKIGASILAAKACLSAGAGLLTCWLPACGYEIMQVSIPEAMIRVDDYEFHITSFPSNMELYQAVGIGPGIGTHNETALMLGEFLKSLQQPLVLDADALNIVSQSPGLMTFIPPGTIITPHPKEFDRLFGEHRSELARFGKAGEMARRHQIIIVMKGHFTGIFYPDGNISFNTTGNPGMAKGGSGDALTGIITALLAQSYEPSKAAALGVYLHGYAGDLAATLYSEEAMLATDLIQCLGKTFLTMKEESGNKSVI